VVRSIRTVIVVLVILQIAMIPSGSALAHEETIADGNDAPGPLDIRSTSVRHLGDGRVVHHIQTFRDWSLHTLNVDSFFVILIDNAGTHRSFERCAFAFSLRGHLKGSLTNCKGNYLTSLSVDKVGGDGIDIKIPPKRLGDSYRWAAETFYTSAGGACRQSCVDSAPNTFPLPFHDVAPPDVSVSAPLLPSDVGTSSTVDVDYSASDTGGTGLQSWVVRRSADDGGDWEDLQSGTAPASGTLHMSGLVEGATYLVQTSATDGQDNVGTAETYVEAPWDDASAGVSAGYSGSWTIASPPAGSYAGTLHVASAENATFELSMIVPADHRVEVVWVAPGTGSWEGTISATWPWSPEVATVDASSIPDLPRQRAADLNLVSGTSAALLIVQISVPAGGGAVPLDALAVILKKV
jgi:hypothetical protein